MSGLRRGNSRVTRHSSLLLGGERPDARSNRSWSVALALGVVSGAIFTTPVRAQTAVSFQEGVNSYVGTFDTAISRGFPNTAATADIRLFVDFPDLGVNTGNQAGTQALIRFDNLFGSGPNQVPFNALITSATLRFTVPSGVSAEGNGGTMHRMLASWPETATWNSVGNGIQADDLEASSSVSAALGDGFNVIPAGTITVTVTNDVQFWANGGSNFGWAILPWVNGRDGWAFSSREATPASVRPLLSVTFTTAPEPAALPLLLLGGLVLTCVVYARRKQEVG